MSEVVNMLYPYPPAEAYSLRRDGVELLRGTERECWAHIHGTFASSVCHALRSEGFEMVPVPLAALAVPPGLYAVQCLTHSRHVYDQEVGPSAIQYRVCGACGSLALFTAYVRLGASKGWRDFAGAVEAAPTAASDSCGDGS